MTSAPPPFIDYGSTPPTLAKTAPHLANYRRVYRASESASGNVKEAADPLAAYLAMYEAHKPAPAPLRVVG